MTVREFRKKLKAWSVGKNYFDSELNVTLKKVKNPKLHIEIKTFYTLNGVKYKTKEEALEQLKSCIDNLPEKLEKSRYYGIEVFTVKDFSKAAFDLPVEEVLDISELEVCLAQDCLPADLFNKYFERVETVSYFWRLRK